MLENTVFYDILNIGFADHAGICREYAQNTQVICREYAGNTQRTRKEYSGNTRDLRLAVMKI